MAASARHISSLESLELDLPPSCIEFCPSNPACFLVGTYDLNRDLPDETGPADEHSVATKPQSRNGSIVVFRVSDGRL
jgi:diphthamide biosynthesis protein 7